MITTTVSDIGKRTLKVVPIKLNGSNGTVDTQDEQPSAPFASDEDGEEGAATANVTVAEDGSLNVEAISGTLPDGKLIRTTYLKLKADADLTGSEVRPIETDLVIITTRSESQGFSTTVTEGAEVPK